MGVNWVRIRKKKTRKEKPEQQHALCFPVESDRGTGGCSVVVDALCHRRQVGWTTTVTTPPHFLCPVITLSGDTDWLQDGRSDLSLTAVKKTTTLRLMHTFSFTDTLTTQGEETATRSPVGVNSAKEPVFKFKKK